MNWIANGLLLYVVFLFSTSCHEAAHAWAALKGGDPTAYLGGQVSLDPVPHIRRSPIGLIVLPLLTVLTTGWPLGFASAPYDPAWAERHPERAGWMALAGPAANLLLAVSAGLLINIGLFAKVFEAPKTIRFFDVTVGAAGAGPFWQAVAYALGAVFALNVLLAVFNLLPVPPLDGSAALVLLLPDSLVSKYQRFLASNPYLGFIGLVIAWQAFDFLFNPVFTGTLNLLYLAHGAAYYR